MGGGGTPAEVAQTDRGFLDDGPSCCRIPATAVAMLDRSFWDSRSHKVDEVVGCDDTGIVGKGRESPGTEAGITGGRGAGTTEAVTGCCTVDGAAVEGCEDATGGGTGGVPESDVEDESIMRSKLSPPRLRKRAGRISRLPPITAFLSSAELQKGAPAWLCRL